MKTPALSLLCFLFLFYSFSPALSSDVRPLTAPTFHIPQVQHPSGSIHTIRLLPDLAITPRSLKVSPKYVTVGDQVTISATVENKDSAAHNKVLVRFTCGTDRYDSFINLRAGEKKPIDHALRITGSAGVREISVEVNLSHRNPSECNYNNNRAVARITVKARPTETFPVLTGVRPDRLQAGKTYSLQLTGRDLSTAMTLDFGQGIQTRSNIISRVTGSGRLYMIGVKVAANANGGQRTITLHYKGRRQPQRPTITVVAHPQKVTLKISPSPLVQGKKYTLDIRGKYFVKGMHISFDKGIAAVEKLRVLSPERARIAVQVAETAKPGRHAVTLESKRNFSSPALMDMPTMRMQGTVEVVKQRARVSEKTPRLSTLSITAISPSPLIQGREYLLNVRGRNFPGKLAIHFDNGIIRQGKIRVLSPAKAIVRVRVQKNARIGKHKVYVQQERDEITSLTGVPVPVSTSWVRVKAAPLTPPVFTLPQPELQNSPRLTTMIPNRWVAGKHYQVAVFGKHLDQVTALSFGRDITVNDLEHRGDHKLTFTVRLADTIKPTVRIGRINSGSRQGKTALRAWIIAVAPRLAKVPPLRWTHEQELEIRKGAIYLEDPVWHYSGDMANNDHPVPVLNDATVFNWREQTPGLADRFEIRFLTPKGTLVYKKTITAGKLATYTTSFKPGSAELMQLFDAMTHTAPGAGQMHVAAVHGKTIKKSKYSGMLMQQGISHSSSMGGPRIEGAPTRHDPATVHLEQPNFAPSPEVEQERLSYRDQYFKEHKEEIDLLWQVVGYKKFGVAVAPSSPKQKNSTKKVPTASSWDMVLSTGGSLLKFVPADDSKQATKDIEIEVSEQWPLRLPDTRPGGVQCDGDNQIELTVDFRRPDTAKYIIPKLKKDKKENQDLNIYVGDTIMLSGSGISIEHSPWAVTAKTGYKQNTNSNTIADDTYSFNNVILDWGDGSWQPLKTRAVPSADANHTDLPDWQQTDAMNFAAEHVYARPGKFPIRIFVVPQDQMSQVDTIVRFHQYVPSNQTAAAGGNKKSVKTMSVGVATPALQTAAGQSADMEMPGSRIYMLYCNPLPITIIQDTDATGPLHLDSVAITSFSSDDNPGHLAPANTADTRAKSLSMKKGRASTTPSTGHGRPRLGTSTRKGLTTSATANPAAIQSFGEDTRVSTCEGGLWAKGKLRYYGQGYARVQWLVDGVVVKSRDIKIGPSALRTDLKSSDKATWGDPLRSDLQLNSPRLPVKDTGLHRVTITASVIPDPTWSTVNAVAFTSSLGALRMGETTAAQGKRPALVPMTGKGLLPAPIPGVAAGGVLSKKWSTSADNTLKALRKATRGIGLKHGQTMFMPPYSVIAPEKKYLVTKNTNTMPCRFLFPTKKGEFEVISLKHLQVNGDRYSGSGKFIYKLPDGPSSVAEHYAAISFKNWQTPDGEEISAGKLQQNVSEKISNLPGMQATLTKLSGTAGDHVNAIMDLMASDTTIRLIGVEKPQAWAGVSAPLTPDGDWYAAGLSLGESLIGWSMTSIESGDVRLDLSHSEGDAPDRAQGGPGWVGINLGTATLHPYMFNLADVPIQVTGWNITADGLNGRAETGGFSNAFGEGSIGWANLSINAFHSGLNANYKNFYVEMAWPKIRLEGKNTHYSYAPGSQVDVQLGLDTELPAINEQYGAIDAVITPKVFQHFDNGWGLLTDTQFSFRDEQNGVFADKVMVNDLLFSIYATAEYHGGDIPLNIKSQVGGADEVVTGVSVSTGGRDSNRKLSFDFTSELSMEGIGRAEVPVHILYGINRVTNRNPWTTGPEHPAEIVLKNHFPETNQAADNEYRVKYHHGSSQVACTGRRPLMLAANTYPVVMSDAWSDAPLLALNGSISGGGCGNDTFGGTIDTHLFGANTPSMTGTFRFGEQNGSRYWLGFLMGDNLHVPVYASVFIEMIQGGMAYNFDHDAFTRNNGFDACPAPGKGLLFSAGLRVSIAGNNVIKADGVLTIQPSDSFYEMLLHAELFNTADLKGRLRYWHSAFDGELWGDVNFLSDEVRIHAPEHSTGLHMDPDMWFFHVGTDTNPIQGHVIIIDGKVYLMLGNKDGFKVGAEYMTSFNKSAGGFGLAAHFIMNGDIILGLSPLRLDGHFGGDLGGKFINPIKDIGINLGADVWLGCCSPPHFALGFHVSCCCVKAGAKVGLIPPGFSPWAACSCCPW